jgi:diacylglycerol kinase (ATP)
MLIVVNPYSAGCTALKKWEKVIQNIPSFAEVYFMDGKVNLNGRIRESVSGRNYEFVAAGGDGTVNMLLNSLISVVEPLKMKEIKLGAIGIGSSNDFHKPVYKNGDIPVKINFDNAGTRDVAFILYKKNNVEVKRYFLVNASVGLTADANHFFNNPDFNLKSLKKLNTNLAITYAALKTIFRYRNKRVKIQCRETREILCGLTNIGIVKNPNFSGSLSYGGSADYNNGKLDIHLCYDMNKRNIFQLLRALGSGRFGRIKKARSWSTTGIEISASDPFNVEFDGEVISTNCVKTGILPKYLQVCND